MVGELIRIEIRTEHDVVVTRQRARQIGALLGFDSQDQTRLATAASEVARNAYAYAGSASVVFRVEPGTPDRFVIVVRDNGPGIEDVQAVLDGRAPAAAGRGMGLIGAKRLVDQLDIRSEVGRGTEVVLRRELPRSATRVTSKRIAEIAESLARRGQLGPMEEMRQQNHELMKTLDVLQQRQTEVERLNRELEETNRGVLALYAELDEKAQALKRASELKSRFLSHMTHELRTPLSSILMLTQLLLDGTQGPLTQDQTRPVHLANRSASTLLELVNDLLDLAKIEAGKIEVKTSRFTVSELFGGLRGVFRPLLHNSPLEFTLEEEPNLPNLFTDEGKVAQILRNLISNALKFTQQGHVRVRAEAAQPGMIRFSVADTGRGIAREHLETIFQEFSQVGNGEERARGTGLGLSLSRRLAELLGGYIHVESEPGVGSTFYAFIPSDFEHAASAAISAAAEENSSIASHQEMQRV